MNKFLKFFKINPIFNIFRKHKIFKDDLFLYFYLELIFTDNSKINTDKTYYYNFKKNTTNYLNKVEFRKADPEDYKYQLDKLIYYCENFEESIFFKVNINKKVKEFDKSKIKKINLHIKTANDL